MSHAGHPARQGPTYGLHFIGDPQSTLTTVSPSTEFRDMKNVIPREEKKALGEENMAVD